MIKTYYVYQMKSTACRHKSYIGISSNPRKRLKSHLGAETLKWRQLTKFGRAVKRYGAHTFTMRIVFKTTDVNEAMEKETQWITRLGSKRVWNSNKGGAYSGKRHATGRKRGKTFRKEDRSKRLRS